MKSIKDGVRNVSVRCESLLTDQLNQVKLYLQTPVDSKERLNLVKVTFIACMFNFFVYNLKKVEVLLTFIEMMRNFAAVNLSEIQGFFISGGTEGHSLLVL